MKRTKQNLDKSSTPFTVSDRIRELAKEHGWPDPDRELDKFLDYHEMGGWKLKNGLPIVDREAAFRTWLRNAKEFARQSPRSNGYVPLPPQAQQAQPKEPELTEEQRGENRRKFGDMMHGLVKKWDVRKHHEKL